VQHGVHLRAVELHVRHEACAGAGPGDEVVEVLVVGGLPGDERLVREVGERHLGAGGLRVVLGQRHDHRLHRELVHDEVVVVDAGQQEADVDRVVRERPHLVDHRHLRDGDVDVGVQPSVAAEAGQVLKTPRGVLKLR